MIGASHALASANEVGAVNAFGSGLVPEAEEEAEEAEAEAEAEAACCDCGREADSLGLSSALSWRRARRACTMA